jgi:hypothetical protein
MAVPGGGAAPGVGPTGGAPAGGFSASGGPGGNPAVIPGGGDGGLDIAFSFLSNQAGKLKQKAEVRSKRSKSDRHMAQRSRPLGF